MQSGSASLRWVNFDFCRSGSLDASNLAVVHTFKARPLDRKVM